jgi:hypothetical protein
MELACRVNELERIVRRLDERQRFSAWRTRLILLAVAALVLALGGSTMVVAQSEALFIDKNGDVGIGTTEPGGNKLRVNGPLRVDGRVEIFGETPLLGSDVLFVVRGSVNADGTTAMGEGFTVAVLPGEGGDCKWAGRYRVTFTPRNFFGKPPAVVVTQMALGGSPNAEPATAIVVEANQLSADIKTGNAAGCGQYRPFSFIAIGKI